MGALVEYLRVASERLLGRCCPDGRECPSSECREAIALSDLIEALLLEHRPLPYTNFCETCTQLDEHSRIVQKEFPCRSLTALATAISLIAGDAA